MRLISYLLINGFAVFLASYVLPGVHVASFVTAIIVAAMLGIVNTFLKPILVILTLPLTLITLGLFTFVINALLVLLTARLIAGFTVSNFWWALIFSFFTAIISSVLNNLAKD